jgi:hypothetical protein
VIYLFTSGEYSDFGHVGALEGPDDADFEKMGKEYLASIGWSFPDPSVKEYSDEWNEVMWADNRPSEKDFYEWVRSHSEFSDACVEEVWVGAYGTWEKLPSRAGPVGDD